jgi:hypothetical protein
VVARPTIVEQAIVTAPPEHQKENQPSERKESLSKIPAENDPIKEEAKNRTVSFDSQVGRDTLINQ